MNVSEYSLITSFTSSQNDTNTIQRKPLILVVDDVQDNLELLGSLLSMHGYQVSVAQSGSQALKMLKKRLPDVMLLDIQMPEMTGFDVCEQVKSQTETRDIPVIFITAQTEVSFIVQGFKAGAVDYVTKPFNPVELLARVQTHVELKMARDAVLEKNRQLEILNNNLQQLNQEKNEFVGFVAHDLKNPLTAIRNMVSLLLEEHAHRHATDADIQQTLLHVLNSADRMFALIKDLLNLNAIENNTTFQHREPVNIGKLMEQILQQYAHRAAAKHIQFDAAAITSDEDSVVVAHRGATVQILDNLLSNALKYSPPHTTITVRVERSDNALVCTITDQGPGFSENDKSKMFTKFARLSARPTAGEHSTGLGLYIVKRLADIVGAKIRCESERDRGGVGARFIVEFALPDHK
jgi:signal transduction histidine kinase